MKKILCESIVYHNTVVNRGGWGRGVPKSTHDATQTDHADQNLPEPRETQTYKT
jgi:hypothetical protein